MVFSGGLKSAILELRARKGRNGFGSRFEKNQEQIENGGVNCKRKS